MGKLSPSRRQFGIGLASTLSVSLAGCISGDDGSETDDEASSGADNQSDENGDEENGEAENGDEEEDDLLDIEPPELSVAFENENGDPVSQGFSLEIDQQDSGFVFRRNYYGRVSETDEIEDGVATYNWDEGTYDITVEPIDEDEFDVLDDRFDDFEPVEEEFEFDGEDTEVSLELEGALADDEVPPVTMDEGTYRIDVLFSELPVGVEGGSEDAGANVEQQEWEDEEFQQWNVEVVDEEDAIHRIEAAHSGYVLQVDDASTEEGATVVVDEWEEEDHQLWSLDIGSSDGYVLTNVNSEIEMVLDGDAAQPGEDILQWPFDGAEAQMLAFEEL
ncbi:RICIN domain-containing protein [Halobacteria archaeon AArc-m2/3/4]|uniref:RICIN domain-containing protein n=1 Tax=Natronoglomus mannanivorans TaxID=2979990 RepID=A0AAP2YZN1_9EURY|nr:RICIN domain-containing protein [Halobacteria archaeon AArc-xg1-1]MCU4973536.1 RICIN domain-containing protein [Halobacteria archaeon AArc-m2/3/4]